MVAAYYKQLTSEDESVQQRAAQAWSVWEGSTSNLVQRSSVVDHFANSKVALS